MFVLQLDPVSQGMVEELITKTLHQANPTTYFGYGLALVVLLVVGFVFYKEAKDTKKSYLETLKLNSDFQVKMIEYVSKIDTRISDQTTMQETIREIRIMLDNFIKNSSK